MKSFMRGSFAALFCLTFLFASQSRAQVVVDQSHLTPRAFGVGLVDQIAQTVTAGECGLLVDVTLHIGNVASENNDDIIVSILAVDAAGLPTTTVLGTTAIAAADIPPFLPLQVFSSFSVDVSSFGIFVEPGDQFAIGLQSAEPRVFATTSTTGAGFAGGELFVQGASGAFESLDTDIDFQTSVDTGIKPEPPAPPVVEEPSCFELLADVQSEIELLLDSSSGENARKLSTALGCIEWIQEDVFWEQPSNDRLSRYGGTFFIGSALIVKYLEAVHDPQADVIIDQFLVVLECIVDNEIAFAIENGGNPNFIDRAEDLADLALLIDEELDSEFIATLAYRLAWLNAYQATAY